MTASNHLRLLITGGSRGIGLAIAKRFSELGHSTTLLATTESTLDTASKALSVLNPRQKHCYIVGDVASQATWDNVKANHVCQPGQEQFHPSLTPPTTERHRRPHLRRGSLPILLSPFHLTRHHHIHPQNQPLGCHPRRTYNLLPLNSATLPGVYHQYIQRTWRPHHSSGNNCLCSL